MSYHDYKLLIDKLDCLLRGQEASRLNQLEIMAALARIENKLHVPIGLAVEAGTPTTRPPVPD